MKISKEEIKDGKPETYALTGISMLELRYIYNGLNVWFSHNRNLQVKAMASDIYASILKDVDESFTNSQSKKDIEDIKKKNDAINEELNKLVPVEWDQNPVPDNLKNFKY